MAYLGKWGTALQFRMSEDHALQPLDLSKTSEANWQEQDRFGKRPKVEFTGMNNDEVTLTIKPSAFFGENPSKVIRRLERAQKHGALAYLIIGGKRVCDNRMYLKSIDRKHVYTWKNGKLAEAEIQLTFKQYT